MRLPLLRSTGWRRVPRFLLAGGVATLFHWLTMLVLIGWGLNAVLATATGATVGLLANYVGQYRFAFCSNLPHRALNLTGFSLLLMAGLSVAPSQIITTGLVAFANYLFAQRFVFHEEQTINVQ